MIQITPQMRILVAIESIDFRKGIDGIARVCREKLKEDPFSGYVFVFRNRGAKAIKILMYDGQGYWLCQKRLSAGRFKWWPEGIEAMNRMAVHELQVLLWNGNPQLTRTAPEWKKIK